MNDVCNKLCRACLTTKESFTYCFFENVSAETFLFCTSVQVEPEDNLPKTLCTNCYKMLTKYSDFKKTCIKSQETLLLQSNTDVKTKDTETLEGFFDNEEVNFLESEIQDVKLENILDNEESTENIVQEKNRDSLLEFADIDVKVEDFSCNFIADSSELMDGSVEDIFVSHKRQKKKLKLKSLKHQSKANLDHKDLGNKKQYYVCDLCQRKFKYRKRFEDHKLDHSNQEHRNLQCVSCNKSFQTLSGLKRHAESAHASVRLASVACAQCGRVCTSRHSLREHVKMHSAKRAQAVCHVCGKKVSSAVILRAHLETHKQDRERRHTCEHCGKKFYTNTILLSHIKRLHTGLRFICGVCEYPFTDKYNLAKHLLIHEGKKLYKCDICDKSYATNMNLIEHKRIHSGERPFLCNFCPKSFLSRRRLIDHHRIHTGDKPHKCIVCEQRFTQRGTLKRHMKVHDPMKAAAHII